MKTKEKIVKNKNTKKYVGLKRSFMFYKKHIGLFIGIIIFSLLGSGLSVLTPIFEGNILTEFTNLNFDKVLLFAGCVLVLSILIKLCYFIWFKVDIKHSLIKNLVNLETKNFDKTNSGVFISRVNSDANELSTFYNSLVDCIADVISNFGFVVYIAFVNIWVALFIVVELVLVYILENSRIKIWFKNRKIWKEANEKVVGGYSEIIRGIRDIKTLNLKDAAINKVSKYQDEAILLSKKIDYENDNWRRFKQIVCAVFEFLFILMCVLFIKYGLLAPTFFIVYVYFGRAVGLINYIVNIKQHLTDGELAAERVLEILDSEKFSKEQFGSKTIENLKGSIEFKNVTFTYNNDEKLFKKLNLKILPNQMVGIVGKSGQGKSTILNLIGKLYDISDGEILIDDVNIAELSESALRDNVSIVMQTPYIFNMSIMDNMLLVNPKATKKQIYNACKKAQIHDFIFALPQKYDSLVGENGVVLSGGQRQRLAIARALLKNSKIILFDEATSALDNESQGKIKEVMDSLKDDHTLIVVAHRLSTVVDCDKILVLDNNKIIAEGTHKQLIKSCNVYKELYKTEELV